MNYEDIEQSVNLQKKAYGLLLWLKDRAKENPAMLKQEPFANGAGWLPWVEQRMDSFPTQLRPAMEEVAAFTLLLSSFFTTSFRVAEVRRRDDCKTSLVAGAKPFRGRRNKRATEARETEAVHELCALALASLATEVGVDSSPEIVARIEADDTLAKDLALWTYARELARRTEFASQGPAVHRLWLSLDEKVRRELSAGKIWEARSRLVDWLKKTD